MVGKGKEPSRNAPSSLKLGARRGKVGASGGEHLAHASSFPHFSSLDTTFNSSIKFIHQYTEYDKWFLVRAWPVHVLTNDANADRLDDLTPHHTRPPISFHGASFQETVSLATLAPSNFEVLIKRRSQDPFEIRHCHIWPGCLLPIRPPQICLSERCSPDPSITHPTTVTAGRGHTVSSYVE